MSHIQCITGTIQNLKNSFTLPLRFVSVSMGWQDKSYYILIYVTQNDTYHDSQQIYVIKCDSFSTNNPVWAILSNSSSIMLYCII